MEDSKPSKKTEQGVTEKLREEIGLLRIVRTLWEQDLLTFEMSGQKNKAESCRKKVADLDKKINILKEKLNQTN